VAVGVPEITPARLKLRPGGIMPAVWLHVMVGLPVAVSVVLYTTLIVPEGNVGALVITGATGAATPVPTKAVGALTVAPTLKVILPFEVVTIVGAKAIT
jgi:hypothetical protein